MLEDSQVAVTISIYKMPLIWPNSAYLFSWETSDSVWCGAVMVGSVAASRDMNWDTGVQPRSQAGCSRISTWSCSCSGSAVPRDQHLNHRSPQGREWPFIQLPATAPRRSPGPALYALAASQPALSQQTRKHSNTFTHLLLPSSYNISSPFPHQCSPATNTLNMHVS